MAQLKNISKKDTLSLDNICYLPTQKYTFDDIGNQILTDEWDMCYCAELAITSTERSNASVDNIKPEICLVLDFESYDKQTKVKYNDVIYSIYRNYPRPDGMVELYCQNKVGD